MTIKLPQEADAIARTRAAAAGFGEDVVAYVASLVLADAPSRENSIESDELSAFDVAKELGLIGCIKDGPVDLATNPVHAQ